MVTHLEVETLPLVVNRGLHSSELDGQEHKTHEHHVPTARWYHAVFHTITAVVGAGVLGLPYAISALGLAGGLIALSLACIVSLYCSYLLASLHHIDGKRYNSYRALGQGILGPVRGFWAVAPFQYSVMVGLGVAYMVAAGESLKSIYGSACTGGCTTVPISTWMLAFAGVEVLLSQLPDLHSLWWVSLIGGAMSLGYSTIAFVASVHIAASGETSSLRRHLTSTSSSSSHQWQSQHLWLASGGSTSSWGRALLQDVSGTASDVAVKRSVYEVLNALGMVSFAYGGQLVQLEIQATLAPQPSPKREMMKALLVSYALVIVAYFGVGCAGYAAFGAGVDADVLLSIRGMDFWVDVADVMVVVHVAASWQVFSMPVFEAMEQWLFSKGWLVCRDQRRTKVCVRTAYCLMCWVIASCVPFFGELMGVIGAVGFTPMSFILPSLLWICHHKHKHLVDFWVNVAIIVVFSCTGVLAAVAAMHNLIM